MSASVSENFLGLSELSGDALKIRIFHIIQEASRSIQSGDVDNPAVLEAVPRLADFIQNRPELQSFREAFSALARASGLWNYIDRESADTVDRLVAEAVTSPELDGITLHREQISVLNELLSGKNVILSAPTSFGKSLIVDALLASRKYNRVAIVLPTIALLDEFRRRLRKRFQDKFDVIMHPGDISGDRPTIFLGTQERILNRTDLGELDLTVVDEFYKLDPARKDERSVTLNAAVYKLLKKSRQFFFLGPNIDGVNFSGNERWSFQFLKTRFSTVAVNTIDLNGEPDKLKRMFSEIAEDGNWPTLVFVSSPDRANKFARDASKEIATSDDGAEFAQWLATNVGDKWPVVRAVEYGFGVHHGRVPRAIASQMVRMFNTSELPVLFCTSTLIEGVNTAAKSVMIFDKKISRESYDFFTFSNIRGRAGRLGQHHVGQVYLFNQPPTQDETEVSPTLFGDDDDAPDDYVVHLDEQDHTPAIDDRVALLQESLGLDQAGLRLASSVGLETAAEIKSVIKNLAAAKRLGVLSWSGYPGYDDVRAVVKVICTVKSPRGYGMFSESQLSYFIRLLRQNMPLKNFLIEYNDSFNTDYEQDELGFDNIFKFLRSCEYGLPQMFSVVELFVKSEGGAADYSLFLHDLSRWFRAEELKNLDEEGVPIQISERFYKHGMTREQLTTALESAVRSDDGRLTTFERRWVAAAFDIAPLDPTI